MAVLRNYSEGEPSSSSNLLSISSFGVMICMLVGVLGIKFKWFRHRLKFDSLPTAPTNNQNDPMIRVTGVYKQSTEFDGSSGVRVPVLPTNAQGEASTSAPVRAPRTKRQTPPARPAPLPPAYNEIEVTANGKSYNSQASVESNPYNYNNPVTYVAPAQNVTTNEHNYNNPAPFVAPAQNVAANEYNSIANLNAATVAKQSPANNSSYNQNEITFAPEQQVMIPNYEANEKAEYVEPTYSRPTTQVVVPSELETRSNQQKSPPIQPRTTNINYLQDDLTNYSSTIKTIERENVPAPVLLTAEQSSTDVPAYEDPPEFMDEIFAKVKPKPKAEVLVLNNEESDEDDSSESTQSLPNIRIHEQDVEQIRNALSFGAAETVDPTTDASQRNDYGEIEDGYDEFGEARPFKKNEQKNVRIDADDIHRTSDKPKIVGTPRPTVTQLLDSDDDDDDEDDDQEVKILPEAPKPKSILKQSSYNAEYDESEDSEDEKDNLPSATKTVQIDAIEYEKDPNKPKVPNTPRPTASQLVYSDEEDNEDIKSVQEETIEVYSAPAPPPPKSILKQSKYGSEEDLTATKSVRVDPEADLLPSTKPRAPATPRPTVDQLKLSDDDSDENDDDEDDDDNWDLVQQHRTSISHTLARQSQTHINDDVLRNMPKIPSHSNLIGNGPNEDDKISDLYMDKPKTLREMQSQQKQNSHMIKRRSADADSDTEA